MFLYEKSTKQLSGDHLEQFLYNQKSKTKDITKL